MNTHTALLEQLQEEQELTRELFLAHVRGCVQASVLELMQAEVEALCGPKHYPANRKYRRGGSEEGVLSLDGECRKVRRPRVREQTENGEREVQLSTYARARNLDNIAEEVIGLVAEGVSTRGVKRIKKRAPSKSGVSRMWAAGSAEKLGELRSRDLGSLPFYGLVMDGIVLSRGLVVVVAVGLCRDGSKLVLDFAVGSSESYELTKELVVRVRERGFRVDGRLLALLDGSKALHKAVLEFWPDALIQACLVHVERNLYKYLRRCDHSECARLLKRRKRKTWTTSECYRVANLAAFH